MRYLANGFIPINEPPARRRIVAATVTIVKGDFLHKDSNGLATNATTSFDSALALGVAAADCDNSGGSSTLEVEYYPWNQSQTQYRVPVAENTVIASTDKDLNVDLENNDDIDISDAVTTGLAFVIDDIDISTSAVAANTNGYAIGHFGLVVTES